MKHCTVCNAEFDPEAKLEGAAAEMGDFFAKEIYADKGELCPLCLANRGQLAMMFYREFD